MRLNAITFDCILLLIGAVERSTGIGMHIWSRNAVESLTLISALIHALTDTFTVV